MSQQVTPTSTSQVSTVKPAQYEKGTAQSSTAAVTVKPGTTPATPAAPSGVSAAGAAGGGGFTSTQKGPSQVTPQVQVEVGPPGGKVSTEELDPFDALSGTLPPSQPVAPKVPVFTGPEVREPNVKAEKGVFCGERDDTLPPGYRRADLEKKTPAGVPEKPKDVPKPISTDEALESLSTGFVSSAPAPKKTDVKTETIGAVDVRSAGMSNFAPPPPSQQTDNSMSLDALSALGDTLGAPEPPKKLPELKPGQIVDEKKVKSEKGVRVGEREDTLPPGYRFTEEELMKYPPPEKQPSLSSDDALDILSGGFTEPAAAPVVKAPVPPAQGKVDEFALDALAGDFVAPAQSAPKVSSSAPKTLPPQTSQTDEDALSALGDTLGAPEPPKKEPELKPKDIVHEKDVTSEKGVRVGEREDTLPPGYRFAEEELKKYPPPPKEPSLSSDDALDILSGGFTEPAAAPVVKAPVPPAQETKKPAGVPEKTKDVPKPSDCDLALDALAGDFVAPSSASKVQSAVSGPPHADRQLSEGTSSALDALSDTLADIKPAPEPAPVSPKDVVKEKNVVEEKVSKPGERDDTLPPDHRFTEEDRKAFEAAKQKGAKPKQSSIDDATALDLLSSEFSAVPPVKPSAPDAQRFIPEPQPPTFKASGPVFDELAEKVIPNLTDPKAKESKPKKQTVEDSSATEKQPGKPSSDVVPSSSTKSGKR
ncbi:calpastatin-like isoform X9 [Labeo rohita]|uniref:Calpastatin n=1 Tax=Labeo rohita TaxID=84645 RepID=A0A498LJR2_LABRO|nr:calpastatin-like isoform X9 [Labeo rohita]RXN12910.1 calpastatin-like isoform X9 [Labeo rohita]